MTDEKGSGDDDECAAPTQPSPVHPPPIVGTQGQDGDDARAASTSSARPPSPISDDEHTASTSSAHPPLPVSDDERTASTSPARPLSPVSDDERTAPTRRQPPRPRSPPAIDVHSPDAECATPSEKSPSPAGMAANLCYYSVWYPQTMALCREETGFSGSMVTVFARGSNRSTPTPAGSEPPTTPPNKRGWWRQCVCCCCFACDRDDV
jgi:hypothetical protein